MQKFLINSTILLLLFLLSQQVNSQFAVGLNAGSARMDFSGDPPQGAGVFLPKPGWSAGLRMDYRLSDAFSISINPGYSVLKSKYSILNDSGTSVVDSTILTLNSFSLPLHAVVWSENGRFYVLAGIELAFNLNLSGKILASPFGADSHSYEITQLSYYAQFGAGFIVPLGKPFLSFEIKYSQGLNDLTTAIVHQGSYFPRTKLVNIHIQAGFHYPIGKSNVYKLRKHR